MSGEAMEGFISAVTAGLSAEAIWGVLTPLVAIIVIVTLVALGRRTANKNLKAVKNGSNGKI